MKKIIFDSSIHLGQFHISNTKLRIAAKNSQILISHEDTSDVIGFESFNENSFSDDIIWDLPRTTQDVFYKFMDTYHTVKRVTRVPLSVEDATVALSLASKFSIDISNALTCAIAIRLELNEIHSFYTDFQNKDLFMFLLEHNVKVVIPDAHEELTYSETDLEDYYQIALKLFKKEEILLTERLHM